MPMLGVKPSQLEVSDHKVHVTGFPQRSIHIGDVSEHARGVNGQPPILQSSTGLCQSPEQIPQGPPIIVAPQMRVVGT